MPRKDRRPKTADLGKEGCCLILTATGESHVGARENNEDVFLFTEHIFVVADGIGGHASGEIASNYAIAVIEEVVCRMLDLPDQEASEVLRQAIGIANKVIRKQARRAHRGMGTTVVALYINNGAAAVGHAGDSRCYRLRRGVLKQITKDHSDGSNYIHRSLGHHPDETGDIQVVDVKEGDIFLLCSDGLNVVPEDQIKKILRSGGEAENLVAAALGLQAAYQDNVTAVVVRVRKTPKVKK